MNRKEAINYGRLIGQLTGAGLTYEECCALIRCEKTLRRWADLECGDGSDHASMKRKY